MKHLKKSLLGLEHGLGGWQPASPPEATEQHLATRRYMQNYPGGICKIIPRYDE
jgi:hypothetical protein